MSEATSVGMIESDLCRDHRAEREVAEMGLSDAASVEFVDDAGSRAGEQSTSPPGSRPAIGGTKPENPVGKCRELRRPGLWPDSDSVQEHDLLILSHATQAMGLTRARPDRAC